MILLVEQNPSGLKELLERLTSSVGFILPEIALVTGLVMLLIFDLIFSEKKSIGLAAIAFSTLSFLLVYLLFSFKPETLGKDIFEGLISYGSGSHLFKIGLCATALGALLMAAYSKKYSLFFFSSSEWLICLFGLMLGAFLMTMSSNLLMIYLSVEVVSICSYLLSGLGIGKKKSEASIKYLLYGAAASAAMLYGFSWLYGLTGSLEIGSDTFLSGILVADPVTLSIALFMVLAGLLFKLGAFPMHIWSPDIYEAVPLPTVTLFSIVPKLAAVFVLFRFTTTLGEIDFDWTFWLGIISIGGMIVGNFSALWQRNAKRMMAYSSIAHAAFILSGILLVNRTGLEAVTYYALIYLAMNLGVFYLLQIIENEIGSLDYDKLHGLGKRVPYVSVLLLIGLISLIGLPPTAGFSAKLFLFSALFEKYSISGDSILLWVFIVGLLNSIVSLFYYIRLPYLMFFKEESRTIPRQTRFTWQAFWGTCLILPLLLLFFRADWFVDLLNSVNFDF